MRGMHLNSIVYIPRITLIGEAENKCAKRKADTKGKRSGSKCSILIMLRSMRETYIRASAAAFLAYLFRH